VSLEILFFSYTARGDKCTSRISKVLCQSQEKFVDCLNGQAITSHCECPWFMERGTRCLPRIFTNAA